MRMNAVLSNPKHPEYGQFTVPLPIPHNQYDGIMEALNAMDMGDPLARDCQMDEILGEYPILKRLEGKPVNIDELDYLAKRLDSFCYAQEGAQFQGAAVSYDYSDMTDLINLTFSCQQVTVITDFSDLEQVGRDHYMVLNGGCASKEELDNLDGYETALLLIDEGDGVVTPYGVVYRLFGVNAELLIDHAWGWEPCTIADVKAYKPENKSIVSGQVLQCPYSFDKARLVVREMADALALDLVDKGLVTNQLVLTVGYDIENLVSAQGTAAYTGAVTMDRYGRKIPKHAVGTENSPYTSSANDLLEAVASLYDRIADKALLVRRLSISANRLLREDEVPRQDEAEQMDLFTDYAAREKERAESAAEHARERKLQETMLGIKKKFGKNAILKGLNLEDGATAKERNQTIGGHRA